jgi:hypothetical protein
MKTTSKKRGSVTVIIMLLFVTLVSMIMTFVAVSKESALKTAVGELAMVWSGAVLAEYDVELQERYGIFGVYGLEGDVARKLDFYAREALSGKKYADYGGCRCSLYDYSLAGTAVMKRQIVALGKLAAAGSLIRPEKNIRPAPGTEVAVLRNKAVLKHLPSAGSARSITLSGAAETLKKAGSIKGAVKKGTDGYFENRYLFTYFKDMTDTRGLGKTFFSNEVEYVINGRADDAANVRLTRLKLTAVREALNMAFMIRDPKMNSETLAAAELMTPGPAAVVTQKLIQAAWSLAESRNDYRLLINGRRVPVIKDEASWATDLGSIVGSHPSEGDEKNIRRETGYIDMDNPRGETYEDYLGFLAYAMDEEVKLLRMMDLIQINMKYCYYEDFELRSYSGGLKAIFTVNGESYEVKKEYEPE